MNPENSDSINDSIREKQFHLKATRPISWKVESYSLKHAADRLFELYFDAHIRSMEKEVEAIKTGQKLSERILTGEELKEFEDGELIPVYFLLIGYAFENLFKAILLIKDPKYYEPYAKLIGINTHNLVYLSAECKISLNVDETALLEKLSTYVLWRGKYPMPLKVEDMLPNKRDDGTWNIFGETFRGRNQQQEIDKLYIKIWASLEQNQARIAANKS